MKKIVMITGITVFAFSVMGSRAQQLSPDDKKGSIEKELSTENKHPQSVRIITHKEIPIVQCSGKTFSTAEISRMAAKDVNSIAATAPGVDYRPGSGLPPVIRGAVGGTAYYVDGVRVYGALPVVTK